MDEDMLATSTERLLRTIVEGETWNRLLQEPAFEDAYQERIEPLLEQLDTAPEDAVPVVLEEYYVELRHLIKTHDPELFGRLDLPKTLILHRAPAPPPTPRNDKRIRAIANEVRQQSPRTNRPR